MCPLLLKGKPLGPSRRLSNVNGRMDLLVDAGDWHDRYLTKAVAVVPTKDVVIAFVHIVALRVSIVACIVIASIVGIVVRPIIAVVVGVITVVGLSIVVAVVIVVRRFNVYSCLRYPQRRQQ